MLLFIMCTQNLVLNNKTSIIKKAKVNVFVHKQELVENSKQL